MAKKTKINKLIQWVATKIRPTKMSKEKTLSDLEQLAAAVEHGFVIPEKMPHNMVVISATTYNKKNSVKVEKKK